jgi:hypothetical protein
MERLGAAQDLFLANESDYVGAPCLEIACLYTYMLLPLINRMNSAETSRPAGASTDGYAANPRYSG